MPQHLGAPRPAPTQPLGRNAPVGAPTLVLDGPKPLAQGPGRGAGERSGAEAAVRPPVPCPLTCNNSTERVAPSPAAIRTAFALKLNVEAAVGRWGLERTGFLTLTFADHVLEPKEAQRRLNSLATH